MAHQRKGGRREGRHGEEEQGGQTSMPGPGTERGSTSASAPSRDAPRAGASAEARTRGGGHVAVGYTDRRALDDFLTDGLGDIVVRGPVRTGETARDVAELRAGVTEGTPCLVVPLLHERMDEIRREVDSVLDRFGAGERAGRGPTEARGEDTRERARHDAAYLRRRPEPRTIGETGGETRGGSAGAYRAGSTESEPGRDSRSA